MVIPMSDRPWCAPSGVSGDGMGEGQWYVNGPALTTSHPQMGWAPLGRHSFAPALPVLRAAFPTPRQLTQS